MQLTRFDRWLRETFVYETHIRTLRPPEFIPAGILVVELPETPGQRYNHLFIARSSKAADALIRQLKESSQMYKTQVVDRKTWLTPIVAPKHKSVTWWIVSAIVFSISAVFIFSYLKNLLADPELRQNISEALQIIQG
ncbi:MAG: hypothetical protein ACQCXQ_09785 [Verrucomicrobiales bacterium]